MEKSNNLAYTCVNDTFSDFVNTFTQMQLIFQPYPEELG